MANLLLGRTKGSSGGAASIEPEIVAAATEIEIFPKLSIPVACPGHLIAMKLLAQKTEDRLRDRIDLRELLARASNADVATTQDALTLMHERGFSRGKNLFEEFQRALQDFAPHLLLN